MSQKSTFHNHINNHLSTYKLTFDNIEPEITRASNLIIKALKKNKQILIAGNGGSASDSMHMAAEITGQFVKKGRKPLPAQSLCSNISNITAIGNDFSFDDIFSRQVSAFGSKSSIFVAISTSGRSKNIIKAVIEAKKKGMKVITLKGKNYTKLNELSDVVLEVKSNNTAIIQEIHISIIHLLCLNIDLSF